MQRGRQRTSKKPPRYLPYADADFYAPSVSVESVASEGSADQSSLHEQLDALQAEKDRISAEKVNLEQQMADIRRTAREETENLKARLRQKEKVRLVLPNEDDLLIIFPSLRIWPASESSCCKLKSVTTDWRRISKVRFVLICS